MSSSAVSSTGGLPASTSASVRPSIATTFVFTEPLTPSACRGVGTAGSPSASVTLAVRT